MADISVSFYIATDNCVPAQVNLSLNYSLIRYGYTGNCRIRFADTTGILYIGATYEYMISAPGYKNASGYIAQMSAQENLNITMIPDVTPWAAQFQLSDSVYKTAARGVNANLTVDGRIQTAISNSSGYITFGFAQKPVNNTVILFINDVHFQMITNSFQLQNGSIYGQQVLVPYLAMQLIFRNGIWPVSGINASVQYRYMGTTLFSGLSGVNGTVTGFIESVYVFKN